MRRNSLFQINKNNKNMNKFLFKLLSAFISKETKLKLAEKELELSKELIRIEADYESKRMRNGYYSNCELTEVEKDLFFKKAELAAIKDSIRIESKTKECEINILSAKVDMQIALNSNHSLEITRLEKIIYELTEKLNSKIEIIK
jgi:hypothetical protein